MEQSHHESEQHEEIRPERKEEEEGSQVHHEEKEPSDVRTEKAVPIMRQESLDDEERKTTDIANEENVIGNMPSSVQHLLQQTAEKKKVNFSPKLQEKEVKFDEKPKVIAAAGNAVAVAGNALAVASDKGKQGAAVNKEEAAFNQAILDRKRESFEQTRIWDEKRTQFLNTHRNFIEIILGKIDKKIRISILSMQNVQKFLRERIAQEEEFCKFTLSKLTKLSLSYKDQEQPDPCVLFPMLSRSLTEIDELHLKKAKGVQEFIKYLDKAILKDFLGKENEEYERKVAGLKERLIGLKKDLNQLNILANDKSHRYSKMYRDMTNPTKTKKINKDLYTSELDYLSSAREQTDLHRSLGRETVKYWLELTKLEVNRAATIQKCFQLYLAKYGEIFGKSNGVDVPIKILDTLKPAEEIEAFYSISQILNPEAMEYIKKYCQNSTDVTVKELRMYLEDFGMKEVSDKPLVLKVIRAQRDLGGITKSFKDCLIIFTIDNYMLVVDNYKDGEIKKPDLIIPVEFLSMKQRVDPSMIDFVEKVPGLLFDSTKKYLIKVLTEDKVEELKQQFNIRSAINMRSSFSKGDK